MLRRKKPTTHERPDGRTLVVVDRLERVADVMERLAAEMEIRLRVRADRADREGNNGTGS